MRIHSYSLDDYFYVKQRQFTYRVHMTGTHTQQGYLRIPHADLKTIRIEHLYSAIDLTIALPGKLSDAPADTITGMTEWTGRWNEMQVSVGWDWGVISEQTMILSGEEIRSNIQLIMENNVSLSPRITRIHLLEWIESLPWRETAIPDLIASFKLSLSR